MDLLDRWGNRLTHVHLTDGTGSFKDEHLMPGEGDQDAWGVVRELGRRGYAGHIALEVSTRRARTRENRVRLLGAALERTRREAESGAMLAGRD